MLLFDIIKMILQMALIGAICFAIVWVFLFLFGGIWGFLGFCGAVAVTFMAWGEIKRS
jgi:Na+/H+-dicarboxylate symporter